MLEATRHQEEEVLMVLRHTAVVETRMVEMAAVDTEATAVVVEED